MKSKTPYRASEKLGELYDISRRILDAFPLSSINILSPKDIESREKSLRREFNLLAEQLVSMAAAEIRIRGLHEKSHDPETDEVTINDAACIAVSFLCLTRRRSGLLEIVEIIRSLFRRNPDAGSIDLFNYLSVVVSRTLCQSSKQKARFENPWFYRIARCVDFHVRSRPRYAVQAKLVIDLEAPGQSPLANSEDMLSICNQYLPIPKKPGVAIDIIFDCLKESGLYSGRVEKRELYLAVYKLMAPHMTVDCLHSQVSTPYDDRLISMMHVEAHDLLCEMEKTYKWRKAGDGKLRTAFVCAGEDIILDKIYFGAKRNSLKEYLSVYIDGLATKEWNDYRGSFQHFVRVLEKKWSEKLRTL